MGTNKLNKLDNYERATPISSNVIERDRFKLFAWVSLGVVFIILAVYIFLTTLYSKRSGNTLDVNSLLIVLSVFSIIYTSFAMYMLRYDGIIYKYIIQIIAIGLWITLIVFNATEYLGKPNLILENKTYFIFMGLVLGIHLITLFTRFTYLWLFRTRIYKKVRY